MQGYTGRSTISEGNKALALKSNVWQTQFYFKNSWFLVTKHKWMWYLGKMWEQVQLPGIQMHVQHSFRPRYQETKGALILANKCKWVMVWSLLRVGVGKPFCVRVPVLSVCNITCHKTLQMRLWLCSENELKVYSMVIILFFPYSTGEKSHKKKKKRKHKGEHE